MRLTFDIQRFLVSRLPSHKRQANRLNLFYWPLSELSSLWDSFESWRNEMIYESNITGQKLALKNLLNKRVAGANGGITIEENEDEGLFLSTASEDSASLYFSTITENSSYQEFPLFGEVANSLTSSFIVYIPAGVNPDEVANYVDRYIIAGFSYEIIDTL